MTWTAMQRTFVLAAMLGFASTIPVAAQTSEGKVGLIAPISGPWARQGELMLKGANLAIDVINREGGIRTLGGAKLKLIVFDAGDTVEKGWAGPAMSSAKKAAQAIHTPAA